MFQVALAYAEEDGRKQLKPGSLRIQRVLSKEATYNCSILKTLLSPSCRLTTDQGSEWARLPHSFASMQTVNHSVEWVTPEGVTTNLGELHNGILKKHGSRLNLWQGNVPEQELNGRWQELSWRLNKGLHKESAAAGTKLRTFLQAVSECQAASGGSFPAVWEDTRRDEAVGRIKVPAGEQRVRRFPAKRGREAKELWRTLRNWLKSDDLTLDLPHLTKQTRWYAHQWCECWLGIKHHSTGEDGNRILHLQRATSIFRRQLRTPENHPDDAIQDCDNATDGPDSSDSSGKEDDAQTPSNTQEQEPQQPQESFCVGVERQEGSLCLKHALSNILKAFASTVEATEDGFLAAARMIRFHSTTPHLPHHQNLIILICVSPQDNARRA